MGDFIFYLQPVECSDSSSTNTVSPDQCSLNKKKKIRKASLGVTTTDNIGCVTFKYWILKLARTCQDKMID